MGSIWTSGGKPTTIKFANAYWPTDQAYSTLDQKENATGVLWKF